MMKESDKIQAMSITGIAISPRLQLKYIIEKSLQDCSNTRETATEEQIHELSEYIRCEKIRVIHI